MLLKIPSLESIDFSSPDPTSIPDLRPLSNLESLSLACVKLKELPPLPKSLVCLFVGKSALHGVPAQVSELSNLAAFHFRDPAGGTISATFCSTLNSVAFDGMGLSEVPKQLFACKLTQLSLSNNALSNFPSGFGSYLKKLDLSRNRFIVVPPQICQCVSLEEFDISKNAITELPAEMSALKALTTVDLSETQLRHLSASFAKAPKLRVLRLCNCVELQTAAPEWSQAGKLAQLDLQGCAKLSSRGLLTAPAKIRALLCQWTGVVDPSIPTWKTAEEHLALCKKACDEMDALDAELKVLDEYVKNPFVAGVTRVSEDRAAELFFEFESKKGVAEALEPGQDFTASAEQRAKDSVARLQSTSRLRDAKRKVRDCSLVCSQAKKRMWALHLVRGLCETPNPLASLREWAMTEDSAQEMRPDILTDVVVYLELLAKANVADLKAGRSVFHWLTPEFVAGVEKVSQQMKATDSQKTSLRVWINSVKMKLTDPSSAPARSPFPFSWSDKDVHGDPALMRIFPLTRGEADAEPEVPAKPSLPVVPPAASKKVFEAEPEPEAKPVLPVIPPAAAKKVASAPVPAKAAPRAASPPPAKKVAPAPVAPVAEPEEEEPVDLSQEIAILPSGPLPDFLKSNALDLPFGHYEEHLRAYAMATTFLPSCIRYNAPGFAGAQVPFTAKRDFGAPPFYFEVSVNDLDEDSFFAFGFLVRPNRRERAEPGNGPFLWWNQSSIEGRVPSTSGTDVFIQCYDQPKAENGAVLGLGHNGLSLYGVFNGKRIPIPKSSNVAGDGWCPFLMLSCRGEVKYRVARSYLSVSAEPNDSESAPSAPAPQSPPPSKPLPKPLPVRPASPRGPAPTPSSPRAPAPTPSSPRAPAPTPASPRAPAPAPTSPRAADPTPPSPRAPAPTASSPRGGSASPRAPAPNVTSPRSSAPLSTPSRAPAAAARANIESSDAKIASLPMPSFLAENALELPFGFDPGYLSMFANVVKFEPNLIRYHAPDFPGSRLPLTARQDFGSAPFFFEIVIGGLLPDSVASFGFMVKPNRSEMATVGVGSFVWWGNENEGILCTMTKTSGDNVYLSANDLRALKSGDTAGIGHDGKTLYGVLNGVRHNVPDSGNIVTTGWCPFVLCAHKAEIRYKFALKG